MKYKIIIFFFSLLTTIVGQSKITTDVKGSFSESRLLKAKIASPQNNYEINKELAPFESIPNICVLNNGNSLLIHSNEGIMEFYDTTGELVSHLNVYELPPYNEQKLLSSSYENGCFVIISERNINRCINFNNNGIELSSFNLHEGNINSFNSSSDGNILVYSVYKWQGSKLNPETFIYDLQQNLEYTFPYLVDKVIFGVENLLLTNNHSYFLINKDSNKLLLRSNLQNKLIIDAKLDSNKVIGLEADTVEFEEGKWTYKNISVTEIQISGKKIVLSRIDQAKLGVELKRVNLDWEVYQEE